MADTPPNAPATPRADARCPHCDHIFVPEEVIDEWCASCGKKIPEVILKDVRPKPHIRHPHPLPEPTKTEQAEATRESRGRAAGLFLMFGGTLGGLGCLLWGVISKMNSETLTPPILVGTVALVVFLAGLGMFASGRAET